MSDIKDPIRYIQEMERSDFHQKIVRGVAMSNEFSWIVTFGAEEVSTEKKTKVCNDLLNAGVPIHYEDTEEFDEKLDEIISVITARSISLS